MESLAAIDSSIPSTWDVCPPLQEETSFCSELTAGTSIAVFNPLAHSRDIPITLDVIDSSVCIFTENGTAVDSQTRPSTYDSTYELAFVAEQVPALGIVTYLIESCSSSLSSSSQASGDITVENSYFTLTVSGKTGKPTQLYDKTRKETITITLANAQTISSNIFSTDVKYYIPEDSPDDPRSGAYVFASNTPPFSFPGPR